MRLVFIMQFYLKHSLLSLFKFSQVLKRIKVTREKEINKLNKLNDVKCPPSKSCVHPWKCNHVDDPSVNYTSLIF